MRKRKGAGYKTSSEGHRPLPYLQTQGNEKSERKQGLLLKRAGGQQLARGQPGFNKNKTKRT